MRWATVLFALLAMSAIATTLFARQWSDASGRHKVEAEFVELEEDGRVQLRRDDGAIFRIAREKLSAVDQAYVQGRCDFASFAELQEFQQATASEAQISAAYEGFLASAKVDDEEKAQARAALAAAEQAVVAVEQHDELIAEAVKLARRRAWDEAIARLRRASRTLPTSLDADLVAGIILVKSERDYKKAENHFYKAYLRGKKQEAFAQEELQAEYVATVNNLALTRIRAGKLTSAQTLWTEIVEAEIDIPQEVMINVERVCWLVQQGQEEKSPQYLPTSEKNAERYEQLYALYRGTAGAEPREPGDGWLYLTAAHADLKRALEPYGNWQACEDRACMACVGEERVECPNRKCKKGTVRSYRYETRYKNTPAGRIA